MLAVGFDRQRNVLLLTLLDTFDNGTMAVMDTACATAPLSLERRAHKPAMCVGFERVIVVPQPELRGLAEKFCLQRSSAGLPAPHAARAPVLDHGQRSRVRRNRTVVDSL